MKNYLDIREFTLHIPGLKSRYRFLHITDSHLLLYDEKTQTPERNDYYAPRVEMFMHRGRTTTEYFEALWAYALAHQEEGDPQKLDGVLLTGDIIDFPSPENLAFLRSQLAKLSIPYVYVMGNHDWSYFDDYHTPYSMVAERPLLNEFSAGNVHVHKVKIGELTFVAVDDTLDMYEEGVEQALSEALKGEAHVLLMQHIPLYIPSLHEDTVKKWKSDLNLGGGDVDRSDNWRNVKNTILAENSPVRALITGHLHFWHEDSLEGKIPQFVTALAACGNASIFTIEG